MKTKMQDMFAQYGRMGIIVYFGIFFLTFFIFWLSLTVGVDIRSWDFFSGRLGDVGTIALAYAATKITQPIRIGLTLVLTPLVARIFPAAETSKKTTKVKTVSQEEKEDV
jgi:hypothetical protein